MMIHDFDMACYLIESDVEEIYATGCARVDPAIGRAGDIDTEAVTLKFKNGVLGTIDCSRRSGLKKRHQIARSWPPTIRLKRSSRYFSLSSATGRRMLQR